IRPLPIGESLPFPVPARSAHHFPTSTCHKTQAFQQLKPQKTPCQSADQNRIACYKGRHEYTKGPAIRADRPTLQRFANPTIYEGSFVATQSLAAPEFAVELPPV